MKQKISIFIAIQRLKGRRLLHNIYQALLYASKDASRMHAVDFAGNMSFLYTLGITPFIMLIIYLMAVVGEKTMGMQAVQMFLTKVPNHISTIVTPIINEAIDPSFSGLLGMASLSMLWSASAIVEGMRSILNQVYRVRQTPGFLWRRALSILEFMLIVTVILGSIFCLSIFPRMAQKILTILEIDGINISNTPSDMIIQVGLFLLLALLYYIIPNIKQSFLSVLPGTLLTTTGWLIIGNLFGFYVQYINRLNYIYGGLFSIVVLELFFYVLNIIFIYGAMFNYHLLALYDALPRQVLYKKRRLFARKASIRPATPSTYTETQ